MSSSSVYQIKERTLECQHIREYPHATSRTQEDVLHLAIKQYIPLDNLHPQEGDITIIGAHANGFPKELYEPLWEELHARSDGYGFRIRSIWIADVAQQGASGVLNEQLLGNDPSWNDHSRDLLHMVNHFRSEMPMPLVGIGHSFGACALVNLALIHPRLLSTLILLDPVMQDSEGPAFAGIPTYQSTFRRDIWPSRAEAEAAFRKQKFFQSWDPRVLDRWCKFGIRETPTSLHPNENGALTLSTTKHQECFTFLRPSWPGLSEDSLRVTQREMVPDIDLSGPSKYPFYRPEPSAIDLRLREVRPSVLYIFGGESAMSTADFRHIKVSVTGTGVGGSGGAKEGKVSEVVVKGAGHLVVMEGCSQCADAAALWLGREVEVFQAAKGKYLEWTKKSLLEKTTLSQEWKRQIGGDPKQRAHRGKI